MDTDFGTLLALGAFTGPSVLLLRRAPHDPDAQVALVLAALEVAGDSLAAGAVVTSTPTRVRVRSLPVRPE